MSTIEIWENQNSLIENSKCLGYSSLMIHERNETQYKRVKERPVYFQYNLRPQHHKKKQTLCHFKQGLLIKLPSSCHGVVY